MAVWILFLTFALLLAIGVPVAFALLISSGITILYLDLPTAVLAQQLIAGGSTNSLLAIPLFVLAGELMMHGGLSQRLIALASALVGHLRGGLAQVSVLSSLFFGGVSGSAIADVSAVGGAMIPQMQKRGFAPDYAVNVCMSAALVALLVPPSHNLILFSAAAGGGLSIADLFAAGIVPALLMTFAIMLTAWLIAVKRGFGVEVFPGWKEVFVRLFAALPGLFLIALIFFGIKAGIFTAIESAAIAVFYALTITALVYRALNGEAMVAALTNASRTSGNILLVIAAASVFGWLLAYLEVPAMAVASLRALADSPLGVLTLIVLVLLALGTFMDLAPMILICTPIFLPVAKSFGIDPIHFGVVLILAGGIGLITPPVGSVLFVGAAIGKIEVGQAVRTLWPFWLAALSVLALIVLFPQLSLSLPALLR
jgi:tripartite ATP-independent transporter DctM subunit